MQVLQYMTATVSLHFTVIVGLFLLESSKDEDFVREKHRSQFIPKVVDGVEVRLLCRPVEFFHTTLGKNISLWSWICALSGERLKATKRDNNKGKKETEEQVEERCEKEQEERSSVSRELITEGKMTHETHWE